MPRQARLDAPGALHHIMVRGINKTAIFVDAQDKARFLERLGENVTEGKCSIYAWVLMDNHVHLLFKSGKHGISAVMRKLLTWYAQYFNRRHNRTGHLFQNRYKSILCDEENYLLALIRYIHLNPLGRGASLDEFDWSSYLYYLNKRQAAWLDTKLISEYFNNSKKGLSYQDFVEGDTESIDLPPSLTIEPES